MLIISVINSLINFLYYYEENQFDHFWARYISQAKRQGKLGLHDTCQFCFLLHFGAIFLPSNLGLKARGWQVRTNQIFL